MKSGIPIRLLVLLFLFAAGCTSTKEFTDMEIIVESNQTVVIKELGLKITNKGCGRDWVSGDGGESYEKPVCELIYVLGGSTKYGGDSFNPVYFGNIEIKVLQMNVWSKEENAVPAGACRLSVKKLEQPATTGK